MKTPEEHRVSDQSHMCQCFSLQPVPEPSAALEHRKDCEGSLRHTKRAQIQRRVQGAAFCTGENVGLPGCRDVLYLSRQDCKLTGTERKPTQHSCCRDISVPE